MKVQKLKNQTVSDEAAEELIDVFAVYWIGDETLFLGVPKNYGGVQSFPYYKVKVIDPTLTGEFIYFVAGYMRGFFHWALIKEKLLDDNLELDATAYKRFLEIIKSEGLVPQDFC